MGSETQLSVPVLKGYGKSQRTLQMYLFYKVYSMSICRLRILIKMKRGIWFWIETFLIRDFFLDSRETNENNLCPLLICLYKYRYCQAPVRLPPHEKNEGFTPPPPW